MSSSSRGFSGPRDRNLVACSSCTAGGFFTGEPPGKPLYSPTFSNPLRVLFCLWILKKDQVFWLNAIKKPKQMKGGNNSGILPWALGVEGGEEMGTEDQSAESSTPELRGQSRAS